MKNILFVVLCLIVISSFTINRKNNQGLIHADFSLAEQQYRGLLKHSSSLKKYPRTTAPDGSLKFSGIDDWTGGFWPGALWYVFEYTGKVEWKKEAVRWTESLENNQYNDTHHDIGFMMYCSYGNAYRLTQNEHYKEVLIQSAKTLTKRYSEQVGCIKSWNEKLSWDGKTLWHYPVIIDNMMNLELLFFASKVTGDTTFRHIAIRHAETTMKNHVRKDYSCFHVVNYDPVSGKAINHETNQGYADNSTWARGQSWGIYGFTMVYRETRDPRFLNTARKMADFYLNNQNLPSDKIPYWDFNAGQPGYTPGKNAKTSQVKTVPRDVSAAAITASGLLELSGYLGKEGEKYRTAAEQMLQTLSSENYMARQGTNNNFLLMHSVGSIPHGAEIDVPLIYADYYFLEALLRWDKMNKQKG